MLPLFPIDGPINPDDRVLVAIMNSVQDFLIARDRGWYRVRLANAEGLGRHWPPQWIAFYHTRVFGEERHAIHYIARVHDVRHVMRAELFPEEPANPKSRNEYRQLCIGPLMRLPRPIPSRRLRRVTFIPTTLGRLIAAGEINDLWLGGPLEEAMWAEFKRLNVPAERRHPVQQGDALYFLDFALYCMRGNLGLELDGDLWHPTPEQAARDIARDNGLGRIGWRMLRFSAAQVREQMAEYCLPTIFATVGHLGGLDDGSGLPRAGRRGQRGGAGQMGLFEE